MKTNFLFALILSSICFVNLRAQSNLNDGRHFTIEQNPAERLFSTSERMDTEVTQKIPAEARKPVVLTFNRIPEKAWTQYSCFGRGQATASHGILTLNSPSDCLEFSLWHPAGIWHKYVSNARGWVIETALKVDPSTEPRCGSFLSSSSQIWANDHTNLVIIGFSTNEICMTYPEDVRFPMDTTDGFHAYRIEVKNKRVRVYVDGALAINHELTYRGAGSDDLMFGDGTLVGSSLTQWDYFSYEVFPVPALE
jgi:hypothetical protein